VKISAAIAAAFGCALACGSAANSATPSWSGVPVLMYHRVDAEVPADAVGRDLTVEPASFAAQLRWLRVHHLVALTAEQLARAIARGERPSRAIVLTFDDGYEDAATTALPLLVKYGVRATFYVSSGFVGTPRHLSWKEMRAMRAAGMEIACHGTNHLDLSTLDRAGQLAEAGGCMRRFAHYLNGWKPVTYAYPAGKFDATTLEIMRSLGIIAAFSERPGVVSGLAQPYDEPRRRVRHDDSVLQFGALATP
jgi:peptidoglycan/xylan/chitin deacetylase (PgdA/CDA1 family)